VHNFILFNRYRSSVTKYVDKNYKKQWNFVTQTATPLRDKSAMEWVFG